MATTSRGARRPTAVSGGTEAAGAVRRTSPLQFFQEARSEIRKVTWPTRQEAMNLTIAVVAMTLAIAVFLGAIDTGLDQLVKPILAGK